VFHGKVYFVFFSFIGLLVLVFAHLHAIYNLKHNVVCLTPTQNIGSCFSLFFPQRFINFPKKKKT
jgi:hypothetical protein